MNIHLYDAETGLFLSEDETTWTSRIDEAAQFTTKELARDIALRERKGRQVGTIVLLEFVQSI